MNPRGFGFFIAANGGAGGQAGPTLTELIDLGATPSIVPVGALVPGPQLTVPRSVKPTAPTSVVWASTGYVDFVADCGADPAGVADCAPAFDRAFALLSAISATLPLIETAVRLFIPPGVYALRSGPVVNPWVFAGLATTVEVVGAGEDATIIQLFGFDPPHIVDAECARVADLTFQGTKLGATADCNQGLTVASIAHVAVIERVRFFNVLGVECCVQLNATTAVMRDVNVSCCGTQGVGVVWLFNSETASVESCNFEDVGTLNNVASAPLILNENTAWLTVTCNLATARPTTSVYNCTFDENVIQGILFDGTGQPLGACSVRGCAFNPPVQVPPVACIQAQGIDCLAVDGIFNSGFSPSTGATVGLVGVKFARLSAIEFLPGGHSTSYYVRADAATRYVRVQDSPLFTADDFFDGTASRSLASTNELQTFGTDTYVEAWPALLNAAVFVGAVVKIAGASTYAPVATTDGVGLAAGVSLDVPGVSNTGRVARRGQIVTVLSDGTTAIAIGDPITNLGAGAAGQVLKATATGTTPIVGTAVTAAASGGGPVLFDMLFETGLA
jgi:hypothetical protein